MNATPHCSRFQFISLLFGIIYLGQELNQEGVMNINGALFLFLTNMTFQNVFAVVNVSEMCLLSRSSECMGKLHTIINTRYMRDIPL